MGGWFHFNLIDPKTSNTVNLILYHDLVLVVIVSVLALVGWFLIIFLCQDFFFKGRWDFTIKENQILELAWTVSPSFVLFGLGLVSLYNLYMMEVGSGVSHSVEAHGNQWFWTYNYSVDMQFVSEGFLLDMESVVYEFFMNNFDLSFLDNNSSASFEDFSSIESQLENILEPEKGIPDQTEVSSENGSENLPIVDPSLMASGFEVLVEHENTLSFMRLKLGGFWMSTAESYGIPADLLKQSVSLNGGFPNRDVTSACILAFGVKNEVKVSTSDVMHSWGVPELGVKADAVPGRVNSLGIIPFMPGFAYGFCYELCGVGHSNMPIVCFITSHLNVDSFLKVQVFNTADVWDRVNTPLTSWGGEPEGEGA